MSAKFRTRVKPHCTKKQTSWPIFRKAEFKQLVKCNVHLPTDTLCGPQLIGCS